MALYNDKEVFDLRESLAELYESEGNLSKAADILIGIDFDSKIRILGDYTKFANYVHIANLCLQDKDVLKAEPYIEKASRLVEQISEPDLILNYKLCKAEYLDMNLKLLEAAKHYHEISETRQHEVGTIEIIEEEMQDVLNSAVTCALLCGACPERSRVLNMLSQDKRCSKLKIYPVLQKVILGEFLYKDDIASLEENLMPHHKTPLPDSSTLLDQMMVEHNLLCTNSEKYPSMLGIDPRKVTKSAAVMSASKMRSALCSVKDEVTKTQHSLRLERDAYGAYQVLQTERRLHLDTAQAHERADRGYSELTETVQNIIKKIVSELDAAADSLGSELESIDLTLSEP
uniref:Uncharacterized protein n=1 Tax=Avena sativa TaxID=4498 RepID=A0ACD5XPP1_AVESA